MKISYLLILSFLFVIPKIRSDEILDYCLVKVIDDYASRRKFVNARDIIRNCSCFSNRIKEKLSPYDCPTIKTISESETSDYFTWD